MYKYKKEEVSRILEKFQGVFNDPGNGVYTTRKYSYVLTKPELNLWDEIRGDAIKYFKDNKIYWHGSGENGPTGHVLSSQVACVNHLFKLRNEEALATEILKNLDNSIVKAEKVDDGFVEFEFTGKNGIGEGKLMRGANCTSVDAVMIGSRKDGAKTLFLIEWKYTEVYFKSALHSSKREEIYNPLITGEGSPFKNTNADIYYYEPFYQLMRQTLLGEVCIKNKEYGCTDYKLIQVIPKENKSLIHKVTSPDMKGDSMADAWKLVLKKPESYMTLAPEELLAPISKEAKAKELLDYLRSRYWR